MPFPTIPPLSKYGEQQPNNAYVLGYTPQQITEFKQSTNFQYRSFQETAKSNLKSPVMSQYALAGGRVFYPKSEFKSASNEDYLYAQQMIRAGVQQANPNIRIGPDQTPGMVQRLKSYFMSGAKDLNNVSGGVEAAINAIGTPLMKGFANIAAPTATAIATSTAGNENMGTFTENFKQGVKMIKAAVKPMTEEEKKASAEVARIQRERTQALQREGVNPTIQYVSPNSPEARSEIEFQRKLMRGE